MHPASSSRRAWPLGLGLVLLLGGIAWLLWGRPGQPQEDRGPRIMLKVDAGAGLSEVHRRGLVQVLQDRLEVQGGLPVLTWATTDHAHEAERARALFLEIQADRVGQDLGLGWTWSWGPRGPATTGTCPPGAPVAGIKILLRGLPLRLAPDGDEQLGPTAPGRFWDLLEALGLTDVRSESDRSLALARAAAAAAPDCALARTCLGVHLYSQIQWNPAREGALQAAALQELEAAQRLVPGHPRGTRELASLLTDTGRAKEALQWLAHALRLRPRVPRLYESLAYAARLSGLLEVSRRAVANQLRLAMGQTRQVGETTLLYLGEWDTFLGTCRPRGEPVDAKAWFYVGYVRLAQHREPEALEAFRAATAVSEGWYGFEDLSRALALALEGRQDEGRKVLASLDRNREALRISDGEFTFKQGEAHLLLGEPEAALDALHRALSQGFSCADWYEKSPFLAPLRTHSRWKSLMQRARERQVLALHTFPPSRFGL